MSNADKMQLDEKIQERFERERLEDQERLEHFLDTGEHISHAQMKNKLKKLLSKAQKAAS